MNLVAIIDGDAYNTVCGFLGSNWYAVAGTGVLALGVIVHFVYAIMLTAQNRKARGEQRYATTENQPSIEWASQNMFVLGLIVILGLALHLSHFWAHMMLPELVSDETMLLTAEGTTYAATDGAGLIHYTFKNPVNSVIYIVWLAALWFHLTHGFWSALQTIGWNNKTWMCRWKLISNIFASIIFLGFFAVVIFGWFVA